MPARKALSRSEDAPYRAVFEQNPQPMWIFDRETLAFLEVNRAAVKHGGYSHEEFLRMSLADIVEEEDAKQLRALLTGLPVDHQRGSSVWRYSQAGGEELEVEAAMHCIQFNSHQAVLAVLIDLTQRRILEEQLRQAQKMEAVGMLAGGIAHDFNNLLTIITGYSQLVLNSLPGRDSNRSAVEQIIKAGERAAALTRQLLAFSRRQVLQPKVLDINQLVSSLGVMLRRLIGEDIDLRLIMGPELGRVNADPGQVEQVIMNLAVNARDAMPHGGALTIETANADLDESYSRAHISVRPGPYVLLAVSDTGVGMDQQTRSRLFEPFFTTKAQGRGTGLGLSIVFGIVKQSGGNIEIYSEPGKGTSVKVYLPRVDHAAQPEPEHLPGEARRGSETILLVEDEDMVRKFVRETLEREGYRILDAAGPGEAQKISQAYQGAIHLMITDVVMPKLGGRELAQRLSRQRPEMKVLYMSGYTDNAVVNSGGLNQAAFLQKPFTPAALARKVRQMLEAEDGTRMRRAGG
ncbi:MAG TPA: ATP-binding protein [Bryobacteraceae bacterium]|nr:ATP-binding protein [Bryobacteraceae bacterium]